MGCGGWLEAEARGDGVGAGKVYQTTAEMGPSLRAGWLAPDTSIRSGRPANKRRPAWSGKRRAPLKKPRNSSTPLPLRTSSQLASAACRLRLIWLAAAGDDVAVVVSVEVEVEVEVAVALAVVEVVAWAGAAAAEGADGDGVASGALGVSPRPLGRLLTAELATGACRSPRRTRPNARAAVSATTGMASPAASRHRGVPRP